MKKILLCAITVSVIFSSCSTMKDISVNSQRDQFEKNLSIVEEAVVPLEAAGAQAARSRQSDITQTRQLITGMEKEAAADADFSGKLTAWSGRLAIIEGRYSEAQRLHRQSNSISSGNIPAVILGLRLEGDPAKRLQSIDKEMLVAGVHAVGVGELNIERGRALIDLGRYAEAAGAFDTAFNSISLNPVYKENYIVQRNRAWELRNTSGVSTGTFGFLVQESISWLDCINILKNETQLLRFITGGRNISDSEIFTRLLDRAFIPFTQDVTVTEWPSAKPNANETVTRAGAAYLVWHLFAESRADRGLLTRYSAIYAAGSNRRAPVSDVPVLSPFFDSVLGCVEREFLSLPDGRNFRPAQNIRAAEFLAVLQKIEG